LDESADSINKNDKTGLWAEVYIYVLEKALLVEIAMNWYVNHCSFV
jgi:hypothetical protein